MTPAASPTIQNSELKYNPYSYTITTKKVTNKTVLKLKMAPCGGFAVSIRERQ